MEVKKREAEVIFNKLEIEPSKKDHIRGWFTYKGKKILPVFYSLGKGDMPGNIGDKFRTSLKLNEEQFIQLKKCPLTKERYVDILNKKGLIQL